MADESIAVSFYSLDSAKGYVEAARQALQDVNATSTIGRHRLRAAKADLDRALECLIEAPITEEESHG